MKKAFEIIESTNFRVAVILIAIIVLFVCILANGRRKALAREKKTLEFIDNCLKNPNKKVDILGSPWTTEYLVCNPK